MLRWFNTPLHPFTEEIFVPNLFNRDRMRERVEKTRETEREICAMGGRKETSTEQCIDI